MNHDQLFFCGTLDSNSIVRSFWPAFVNSTSQEMIISSPIVSIGSLQFFYFRSLTGHELVFYEGLQGDVEIPVIKNAALDERMYGSLQGLNKSKLKSSMVLRGLNVGRIFNRTIPYYRTEIEPRLTDPANVLIVAHGNSLRALAMYLEYRSGDHSSIPYNMV